MRCVPRIRLRSPRSRPESPLRTIPRATIILAFLQIATQHPQAIAALHQLWAYITLGATGIVTEEATPLIGGLMAHDRYLRLSTVMFSVAAGTWVADLGLY
jgi:hypothetical protein